jgi:hypothetical protein
MSTYKTFADCKLAHPECDVYVKEFFGDTSFSPSKTDIDYVPAVPSDYLMSVYSFLSKGFELAGGDIYIGVGGDVIEVDSINPPSNLNRRWPCDKDRYILKAKALESLPSHGIASIQSASGHIESINDYPIEQVLRGLETEVKSASGHPSSSAKLYKACLDMLSAIDGERLTQRAYGFYCEFHGEQAIDFDEWVQDEDQRAPWEFMVKRGGL